MEKFKPNSEEVEILGYLPEMENDSKDGIQ